jgi:hypothetical protein
VKLQSRHATSIVYGIVLSLAVLSLTAVAISLAPGFVLIVAAIADGRWQAALGLLVWVLLMMTQFGLIRNAAKQKDQDQDGTAIAYLALAVVVPLLIFLAIPS